MQCLQSQKVAFRWKPTVPPGGVPHNRTPHATPQRRAAQAGMMRLGSVVFRHQWAAAAKCAALRCCALVGWRYSVARNEQIPHASLGRAALASTCERRLPKPACGKSGPCVVKPE